MAVGAKSWGGDELSVSARCDESGMHAFGEIGTEEMVIDAVDPQFWDTAGASIASGRADERFFIANIVGPPRAATAGKANHAERSNARAGGPRSAATAGKANHAERSNARAGGHGSPATGRNTDERYARAIDARLCRGDV